MRRAVLFGWVVLVVGCGAASTGPATSPWSARDDIPRVSVPVQGAPARGAGAPLVTMIVFSDFQCPHCRHAAPVLERILETYPSDVRLYFRHLPLRFHEHAALAAEAAEEARAQGGDAAFWRYHDALLAGGLGPDDLIAHASRLGLDAERFRIALRGHVHRAAVVADMALADELGVQGTPMLFVNGRPLFGVPPLAELRAVVDEELALAREGLARGIDRDTIYTQILRVAQPTLAAGGAH